MIHEARVLAHGDIEVAHEALDPRHLAGGAQGDLGMLRHVHHQRGEDTGRAVERGEGLVQHRHLAADGRGALHQRHLVAGIGHVERGLDAGNAAADDQQALAQLGAPRAQRLIAADLGHEHTDDVNRLGRGDGAVVVHPGDVLAQIRHFHAVRVDARGGRGPAEGRLVHAR